MKNLLNKLPKIKIPTAIKTFARNIFALLAGVLPIAIYILAIYSWQILNIPLTLNLTVTTFVIFALSFFACGYFGTGKNSNSKTSIFQGSCLWAIIYGSFYYYFGNTTKEVAIISLAIAIFFAMAGNLSASRLHKKQGISAPNPESSENLDIGETAAC